MIETGNYCVYGLKSNADNIIRYIGVTNDIKCRMSNHLRDVKRTKVDTHKKKWINRCLTDGEIILFEILEDNLSQDKALKNEIYFIKLFKSYGAKLVNGTLGGDGVRPTAETMAKIAKNRKPIVYTDELRKYMSEIRKGKPLSESHRKSISDAHKKSGFRPKTSPEISAKIAAALTGKVGVRKGCKINYIPKGVPVHQYDINGNFIKSFTHITIAAKEVGALSSSIIACAKNLIKTSKGYKWSYHVL